MLAINLLKTQDEQQHHLLLLKLSALFFLLFSFIILLFYLKNNISYKQENIEIHKQEKNNLITQQQAYKKQVPNKEKNLQDELEILNDILNKTKENFLISDLLKKIPKSIKILTLEKHHDIIYLHAFTSKYGAFNYYKNSLLDNFKTVTILDLQEKDYLYFKLSLKDKIGL